METKIIKQKKYLRTFLADEYSIIAHIEEDPHGRFGNLRTIPKKKLIEYISLLKKKY